MHFLPKTEIPDGNSESWRVQVSFQPVGCDILTPYLHHFSYMMEETKGRKIHFHNFFNLK